MMTLNNENWNFLKHAYGKAGDIPELIQSLDADDEDDLLFGYLCHQSTLYSATFAAMPHLYQKMIHSSKSHKLKVQLILFFACVFANDDIENYSQIVDNQAFEPYFKNADIANDLKDDIIKSYLSLVKEVQNIAFEWWNNSNLNDEERDILIITILATTDNCGDFAKMMLEFLGDEYICVCPDCQNEIYFCTKDSTLVAYADEPVQSKSQKNILVKPLLIDESKWNGYYDNIQLPFWLKKMAYKYQDKSFYKKIDYLFGEAICPHCSYTFNLAQVLRENFA